MELLAVQDVLDNSEEDALVARCRAGDRVAWQLFFDRHFLFVVRSARRLGTPADEAEDVAQEVFTLAFQKIGQLQHGKASWWLYRICSNVASAHHRRRRVRQAWAHLFGEPGRDERTPEDALTGDQAHEQVSKILERMGARKREVLVLFEIEGLSGEEISQRLGCPVDTVWTRLHHARKQFTRLGRQLEILEESRGVS
jgi:RNA polymerase sigma-70 factor (ECF subfamily)